MRGFLLATVIAATSLHLEAQTITYEIYQLESARHRSLITSGTKAYSLNDISVEEQGFGERRNWSKQLLIAQGFSVGASVFYDKRLTGFGLWMRKRPEWYQVWSDGGFSWEWFDQEAGPVFRKRQGEGRVKITLSEARGFQELTSVEFLDDVTFRLNDNPWFFFSHAETHHLVIRKGSVLRIAP